MIYCNVKGGLGNILFQIATTLSISEIKNVDYTFPNFDTNLQYLNQELVHNPNLKTADEYKIFLNFFKVSSQPKDLPTYSFPFHYEPIELPDDNFIIDGFFQSEKYFINSKNLILKHIRLSYDQEKVLREKYDYVLSKDVTSLHVRRGDYLKFSNIHHPLGLDYFQKSINMLLRDTEIFLVFSDDIDWCKDNFKMNNVVFVEGEKDYNELFLMSYCKNNIISNSSFSWWGGWLNNYEYKKVIGPNKWFSENFKENAKDIIPDKWIKI